MCWVQTDSWATNSVTATGVGSGQWCNQPGSTAQDVSTLTGADVIRVSGMH